ncbi:MAG TPA: PAS domain-containing sensor histidine kinase, partial [Chitinophagaceae bacterium]|nr:PAS domain-containing sensor histidine kinase [Chitinophagaceae bacterium]
AVIIAFILLGRLLEETIIPEKYREAHRNGMARYRETGVGQLINRPTEITALHRSGREFPIELSIVPVKNGKEEFFCAFIRDITDRKKAQEKLSRSYEEIRRLASHLQDVREEERLIIAREIHDQLGQQLTIMKMDISWLKKRLDLPDNELASEKIESLHSNIDDTIKTVRKIAADLRPGLLDDLGLGPAIEWHINEFEKRTGIEVEYEGLNEEIELSMAFKTGLFRIVQEALTNIAKYARARHVKVRLLREDEQLSLMVRDNGIGFDKEKVYAKKTYGIVGMRERTAMMGGKYQLETTPGMGTTILVQVPLVPKMAT